LEEDITSFVAEDAVQYLLKFEEDIPFVKPANPKFTFIDLFAGIGGFRIAMQANQGECVFSSEWDKYAQRTYEFLQTEINPLGKEQEGVYDKIP